MLRAEIQAGSELGRAAQTIMDSGGLVDDGLINKMLASRVSQRDAERGFLLDGYPRTLEQAEFLDRLIDERHLSKPVILHLNVPLDALVGRLTSRRQCPKCGTIYNLLHQPPKRPDVCDNDNTPLVTRQDDREDVVRERLKNYLALSRPVLAHYQDADYHEIRGDRSPGYVFEAITGILEPLVSKNGATPPRQFLSHSSPATE